MNKLLKRYQPRALITLELIYVNFTLAREPLEFEFFGGTQNKTFNAEMTLLDAVFASIKHRSHEERTL